jgi:hypothetical protein
LFRVIQKLPAWLDEWEDILMGSHAEADQALLRAFEHVRQRLTRKKPSPDGVADGDGLLDQQTVSTGLMIQGND